mmetsp:Transcript_21328/g.24521  ORF Transcript_21328/g.24521 Transcript_21328/m.24521 type:complete len:164 (-) Transcript_21328:37-528(-)
MIKREFRRESDISKAVPLLIGEHPKTASERDSQTKKKAKYAESTSTEKESVSDLRVKNRESACKSRKKKKLQIASIESEFENLKTENIKLQKNIDCYTERIKNMEQYNNRIKQTLEYMQLQQSLIMIYLCKEKQVSDSQKGPQMLDLNSFVISKLAKSLKSFE